MSFCPEKKQTAETNNCLCVTFSLLSASPLHHTFIFPRDGCGGRRTAPPCTRAHTHYIISAAKNTVTQYPKFPLELLPAPEIHPRLRSHDLLRTGKAQWRHVIHYGEVKKKVSGWKRRGSGERYGRRRTGGRGFRWSRTRHNRITKGTVEMLEEGRKDDRPLSAHGGARGCDLRGAGREAPTGKNVCWPQLQPYLAPRSVNTG